MHTLILASSSPRRKDLLEQIKMSFTIIPSNVEENIGELNGSPADKVEELAYMKARDVANGLEEGLVLGADTIVVTGDVILGKPKDSNDAFDMLSELSGKEHQVVTGLALIDIATNTIRIAHETTYIRFRELSADMIRDYINSGEPQGKAGSYAIQGIGAVFVEEIRGSYSNVVGLPLYKLNRMLEDINIFIMK